jgi:hypothetical protein
MGQRASRSHNKQHARQLDISVCFLGFIAASQKHGGIASGASNTGLLSPAVKGLAGGCFTRRQYALEDGELTQMMRTFCQSNGFANCSVFARRPRI